MGKYTRQQLVVMPSTQGDGQLAVQFNNHGLERAAQNMQFILTMRIN